MNDPKHEIRWLSYLEGELEPTEAQACRDELAGDPQLAARIEEMQQQRELLRLTPRVAAPGDLLGAALARTTPSAAPRKDWRWSWRSLAAAACLLFSCGLLYLGAVSDSVHRGPQDELAVGKAFMLELPMQAWSDDVPAPMMAQPPQRAMAPPATMSTAAAPFDSALDEKEGQRLSRRDLAVTDARVAPESTADGATLGTSPRYRRAEPAEAADTVVTVPTFRLTARQLEQLLAWLADPSQSAMPEPESDLDTDHDEVIFELQIQGRPLPSPAP